jgi:ABC-type antimicrobial peptide transport system permease subunit
VRGALRDALANVRSGRGRAVLRALGTGLAAAMLAVAATVGYGLHTGFSRSARAADLPDVIARFDALPESKVLARIQALPSVAAVSLRDEITGVSFLSGSHSAGDGVVEIVGSGRRGYAIVAGRDISGAPHGVVLEAGLARAWGLALGQMIDVGELGAQRIVGLARSPDNVAFPLAAPRVYVSRATVQAHFGSVPDPNVDLAEIWLRDPAELDAVLVQARITSYGLHDLSIITRSGLRVLIDEAAGIVIALLAALSLVALLTAAVMLGASARAEVQRRLMAIGVRRAIGASREYVTAVCALEALIVAVPAAALGVVAGALVGAAPSDRLLALLNEASPGTALALPLAGCFAIAVAVPTLLAAWPAWRATSGPPVALLRGAELRRRRGSRPLSTPWRPRGLLPLGARIAMARRVRLSATVVSLATCAAFILLLLALANELSALENDPAALGRRYQLTATLPAGAAKRVRSLPGVEAVAPRYELSALDAFSLGEVIDVIAYPGDQTTFEDPPVLAGASARGRDEADVGMGLAQVLGLGVGSTLALALPTGQELRMRVAGVVSSLEHDGRVAYLPAAALLAADPSAPEQLAVRVAPGVSASAVAAALGAQGASASATRGVAGGGGVLVSALESLLRAVAGVDVLVCLYTLVQALTLTASERRSTIALLRACGASARSVRALLAGAALAVLLPAALVAVVLERVLLGPAIAHIAAGYAALALGADAGEIALLLAALTVLAMGAAGWVAARAMAEPVTRRLA